MKDYIKKLWYRIKQWYWFSKATYHVCVDYAAPGSTDYSAYVVCKRHKDGTIEILELETCQQTLERPSLSRRVNPSETAYE